MFVEWWIVYGSAQLSWYGSVCDMHTCAIYIYYIFSADLYKAE